MNQPGSNYYKSISGLNSGSRVLDSSEDNDPDPDLTLKITWLQVRPCKGPGSD